MKIGVVSSKEEIHSLGANEQVAYLTFRSSNADILSIVTKCPKVKALYLPSSYMKTTSKSTKALIGFLHSWNIRKHAYRNGFV